MGCDIHIVGQYRPPYREGWREIDVEPLELRNYTIFGWLANVREYTNTAIAASRGLPSDLRYPGDDSGPTVGRLRYADYGFSWASWEELVASKDYIDDRYGSIQDFQKRIQALIDFYGEGRLIFGFDN